MLATRHAHVLRSELRPLGNWKTTAGVALLVAMMSVVPFSADLAWAEDADSAGQGSDDRGIQVAAWAFTVPYIIGKGAFAAGGAVVGALGYVFSGGSEKTAKAVWTKSIYGTYIIRPAHLRGEEAVHFLGEEHERQEEPMPAPDQPPSQPLVPETK